MPERTPVPRNSRAAAVAVALAVGVGGCSCNRPVPGIADASVPADAGPPLPIQLAWSRIVNVTTDDPTKLPDIYGFAVAGDTAYVIGPPEMASFDLSGHALGRVSYPAELGRNFVQAAALPSGRVVVTASQDSNTTIQTTFRLRSYDPHMRLAASADLTIDRAVRSYALLAHEAGLRVLLRTTGASTSPSEPEPTYLDLYAASLPELQTAQSLSEPEFYSFSNLVETPSGKLAFCGTEGGGSRTDSRLYRVAPGAGVTAGPSLGQGTPPREIEDTCHLVPVPQGILATWYEPKSACDFAALFDAEGESVLSPGRCVLPSDRAFHFHYVDGRAVAIALEPHYSLKLHTIDMTGPVPEPGPVYDLGIHSASIHPFLRVHDGDVYLAFGRAVRGLPATAVGKLCPFSHPRCYVPPPPADAAALPDARPPDAAAADARLPDAAPADAGARDAAPAALRIRTR